MSEAGVPQEAGRTVTRVRDPFGPLPLAVLALTFTLTCVLSVMASAEFGGVGVWLVPLTWALVSTTRTFRGVSVTIDAQGLRVDGRLRVPRARMAGAYLALDTRAAKAVIEDTFGASWLIACGSRTEAEALLDGAGLGLRQRRVSVKRTRVFYQLLKYIATPLGGIIALTFARKNLNLPWLWDSPWVNLGVFAAATFALAWVVPRLDITLGADGYETRHRGRRFVPWSRVRDIRAGVREVVVTLVDDMEQHLWCYPDEDWVLDALVARMREAHAAFQQGEALAHTLQALDRKGQTFEAWTASLRTLLTPRHGYRETTVTRDALQRVLDDPTTSLEQRVGAAIALQAEGDGGTTTVRAAAELCASDAVRQALDEVTKGTLDGRRLGALATADARGREGE